VAGCSAGGQPRPAADVHDSDRRAAMRRSFEATKAGVGFGTALAISISWSVNHSIIWAIIHGLFSWFYVIYYAISR
jgi:hypothetical protein